MLTVVKFLRNKKWLDVDIKFQTECYSWFDMLLDIIDFNDEGCLKCVSLIVKTPKDAAFNWINEVSPYNCIRVAYLFHCVYFAKMNRRLRDCCHSLSVEKFQPIYGATKFWQLNVS